MTKIVNLFILTCLLSMSSVYSHADCIETSFEENYLNNFNKKEIFFIKGVALDIFEYGRKIKVIEDLKGNFVGDSSIFVWGMGNLPDGSSCMTTERWDIITQYQENDTLIMLISPVAFENCIEALSDYATITCAYSILKLSNDFVTGYIHPWPLLGETTMSWEVLRKLLENSTANQSVKIKNNHIYQKNGTIFFENSENKVVKLLFYNLSGMLVLEANTTSNNYRPGLKGNIFICRIYIDNEMQTFKYVIQ